jgi:hypothetical protein
LLFANLAVSMFGGLGIAVLGWIAGRAVT